MHDAAHFTMILHIAASTLLINFCHKADARQISRSHRETSEVSQGNGE